MGPKNLRSFIQTNAPGAFTQAKLEDFADKSMYIDISTFLYKWHYVGVKNGVAEDVPPVYLTNLERHFTALLCCGIEPIYIFDGPPSEAKKKTMASRKANRDEGKSIRLPKIAYSETEEFLTLSGISYGTATADAESFASFLSVQNDGVVCSSDLDCLVFGANIVVTSIDFTQGTAEVIDRKKMLAELGISQNKFIKLCCLFGNDYCTKPKRVSQKVLWCMVKNGQTGLYWSDEHQRAFEEYKRTDHPEFIQAPEKDSSGLDEFKAQRCWE